MSKSTTTQQSTEGGPQRPGWDHLAIEDLVPGNTLTRRVVTMLIDDERRAGDDDYAAPAGPFQSHKLVDEILGAASGWWRAFRQHHPSLHDGNIHDFETDEVDRICDALIAKDRATLLALAGDERVWNTGSWGGTDVESPGDCIRHCVEQLIYTVTTDSDTSEAQS